MGRLINSAKNLDYLPIIGLCGSSGAGKTTLVEALVTKFQSIGLRVAVVKHGAHRVEIDTPGKDSDRFFQAGADVALFGEEYFFRKHDTAGFHFFLRQLCLEYDLVLVEGHATTEIPKIWVLGDGHLLPPENAEDILRTITPDERKVELVFDWIFTWLKEQYKKVPLFGCLLIGGKSRRMGQPKHLIEQNGTTWIEAAVAKLDKQVQQVVLSGSGEIPASLSNLPRLPDVPGLEGPLAGLLSVLRWHPMVSWIVTACDQPDISSGAVNWLKTQRRPGVRAILPDLTGNGYLEPLLAWYDYRTIRLVEELAAGGNLRISGLAGKFGVISPQPPPELHGSWRNVNTPDELLQGEMQ
jgi:molybdopterin-guanine dinucleotide biosynthesis protein MobB